MTRRYADIHDLKIAALDDLVEELNGEPLLIAYEFAHDLERIQAWHLERFKTALCYLGKGTTAKQEDEWCRLWNQGKLAVLAAHPASAGHGLNMQGASAANVCWFGITWDYELYDQFIRRIRRDGTNAIQIFNHLIIVKGTIDELKLAALRDKDLTQTGLMRALNAEILRDADTPPGPGVTAPKMSEAAMKLSRPGGPSGAQQQHPQEQTAQAEKPAPKGWGQKGAAPASDDQRERIQETINPEANRSAFSRGVQEQAENIRNGAGDQQTQEQHHHQPAADVPPAPKTRRRAAAASELVEQPHEAVSAAMGPVLDALGAAFGAYLRLQAVKIASQQHFAESFEATTDLFTLADEIVDYAQKPF